MECFWLAVSVVLPLIIYMTIGVLIKKLNILSEKSLRETNGMIFKIMMPLALFFSIYRADIKSAVYLQLYVYIVVCVVLAFGICWIMVKKKEKDPMLVATIVQGMYRSNFALFGVSVASTLCDIEGVACISALTAIVVPIFNISSVVIFEISRGERVSGKRLVIEIFKNPLVDAGILGIAVGLLSVSFPEFLVVPLEKLGNISTPLALVVLGGMLSWESVSCHKRWLISITLVKLVVIPLIVILIGIVFGFRGSSLIAMIAVFATPTAVGSTPMAQMLGGDERLAGEIVAVTSVACILTLFVGIFVLSRIGYI